MADKRRCSSSGGRLRGCTSWSREDRENFEFKVGPEVEEDRLWEKKRDGLECLGGLVGDLEDLEGDGDLVGDLEGDFGNGEVEAEKEFRERESGLCSLSFSFFSLSLSFLKRVNWPIGGGGSFFFFF
jgi:hypothetical protein